MGYLYHLRVLLLNLRSLLSLKTSSSSLTLLLSVITIITGLYESNNNPISFDTNNNYDSSDSLDSAGDIKSIDSLSHIIDDRSDMYLILMQILLDIQHDSLI